VNCSKFTVRTSIHFFKSINPFIVNPTTTKCTVLIVCIFHFYLHYSDKISACVDQSHCVITGKKVSQNYCSFLEASGLWNLNHQGLVSPMIYKPLKMKVLHFFTASGYTALPTMQCNIPQDQGPQLQCSGSSISCIFFLTACLH